MSDQKPQHEIDIRIDDHPHPPKQIVTIYTQKGRRFWITRTHDDAVEKAAELAATYERLGWKIGNRS